MLDILMCQKVHLLLPSPYTQLSRPVFRGFSWAWIVHSKAACKVPEMFALKLLLLGRSYLHASYAMLVASSLKDEAWQSTLYRWFLWEQSDGVTTAMNAAMIGMQ